MYDSAAYWAGKVVRDYKNVYDFDTNLRDIYDVDKPTGPEHIFIMPIDRSGTQEGNYSKLPFPAVEQLRTVLHPLRQW